MRTRACLVALLAAAAIGTAAAADWEVVLLKPRGCTQCVFVEELLKRSSQLRQAVLDDGAGGQVTAAIQRRDSAELAAAEWTQLRALPYFDELLWRQQVAAASAQVLLRRDGVIVSAGNIADSADLRGARYPPDLNMPDTGGDPWAVRKARSAYASDLFLRFWNLDWFYRLALDPAILQSRNAAAWIAANPEPLAPPLGAANVLLISTASGAADNEIFNALRIEEIRDVLKRSLATEPAQLRIFYGSGSARGANALEVRNGRVGLVRREVTDASPFTPEAAVRIFQASRARPGARNLLVLIGHGNPEGAGMWGSLTALSPATLRSLHEHGGGDDVLVSGNCFGGVMARAMSCGFFAARPDIVATGCQADAAEVAQSRDYLHMFFSALEPAARAAADSDADGDISFAEAHWYASTEGDPRNVTYTSIDALADAWFEAHPEALPPSLPLRDVQALAAGAAPAGATAAETRALRNLVAGHGGDVALSLADPAGLAARWTPNGGQPRALVAQLTRRLLFIGNAPDAGPELAPLRSCENRSVAAFLAK